jgi:hypothetical protein
LRVLTLIASALIKSLPMPKAKFDPAKADGYRLRMICNQWYILLYKGETKLGALGPWSYAEANSEADKLTITDIDKSERPKGIING